MPQKPNRNGMQDYIPAGNGDPSGEYADGGGANTHYQPPKKENISKKLYPKMSKDQYGMSTIVYTDDEKGYNELLNAKKKYYRDIYWYETPEEFEKRWTETILPRYAVKEINNYDELEKEVADVANKYEKEQYIWTALRRDNVISNLAKKYGAPDKYISKMISNAFKNNRIQKHIYVGQEFINSLNKIKNENKKIDTLENNINKSRYYDDVSYRINCQSCAVAFGIGMIYGVNVEALPNTTDMGTNYKYMYTAFADFENYDDAKNAFDEQSEFLKGKMAKTQAKAIKDYVKNSPDGSVFLVKVHWKGSRNGHAFNVYKGKDGEAYFIDTQKSDRHDNYIVENYFASNTLIPRDTKIIRLNDLTPRESLNQILRTSKSEENE